MSTRYEWLMGPLVVSGPKATQWHAGKAKLERRGTVRLIIGQVRDTELKLVLNWVMTAPDNVLRAKLMAKEYADSKERAPDWMPKTPNGQPLQIPKGWTPPKPGAPFEQGLVA